MFISKLIYINLNLDTQIDKYYKLSLESGKQLEAVRNYLSDLIKKNPMISMFILLIWYVSDDRLLG